MVKSVVKIIGLGIVLWAVSLGVMVWYKWPALKPVFIHPPLDVNEINVTVGQLPETKPSPDQRKTVVEVFAQDLGPVRFLAWSPDGVLIASITRSNKVVALPDENKDGRADKVLNIVTGLNLPHGLAWRNRDLFIAETDKVIVLRNVQPDFSYDKKETIITDIPGGANHFTRTLAIGPDEKLYISVGSSCNVCNETNPYRAAVLQAKVDGGDLKLYASGLRNSVGLTFRPGTDELWGTDNGRDRVDDDLPPEEVNIIREGKNYGWPICYGEKIHDTDFDKNVYVRDPCADTIAPHIEFQAHSAPLGLRFYQGEMFSEFAGDLFVANHGSWNRSIPTGYNVMRFEMDGSRVVSRNVFLDNWLRPDGSSTGRPVDIIFDQAGQMFISDDASGVIYLVTKR